MMSHRLVRRTSRYPPPTSPTPSGPSGTLCCPSRRGRGGRWEKHSRRMIVDALLYVVDNGIKSRALPVGFPPWPTVRSKGDSPCGRRPVSHSEPHRPTIVRAG
ncbi:transposase [Saccharothrix saharensis]|uniref:transposase n=1 Tax=Saccharothrix saharensis TaxID=571190 RepID=UPI00368F39E5